MNPPHAGRSTRRVSFYRCIFNSFFFILKNGGALSAAMGAAAKRACRLQERRSSFRKINCLMEVLQAPQAFASSASRAGPFHPAVRCSPPGR